MKYYFYFCLLVIVLSIAGLVTQPENFYISADSETRITQIFGLFGVLMSIPWTIYFFRESDEKLMIKKIWNTSLASGALFFLMFLYFSIAGHGLSGHVINWTAKKPILMSGEYSYPRGDYDSHGSVHGHGRMAILGAIFALVRGSSGESLVFHENVTNKVYSLSLNTAMASNKLKFPNGILPVESTRFLNSVRAGGHVTVVARKSEWGIIIDEMNLENA